MTDPANIVDFPQAPDPLVGPFSEYRVVVEGRQIPMLTGFHEGDKTFLVLDHRLSIGVPKELASQVAWFAASCLAVGQGYSHIGAASKDMPFAPQVMELGELPHD